MSTWVVFLALFTLAVVGAVVVGFRRTRARGFGVKPIVRFEQERPRNEAHTR